MYEAYVKEKREKKKEYLMCIENEGIHGVCKTVRHSLFVCAVSIVAVQYKRFYIFIISIAESDTKSMVQFKKKQKLFFLFFIFSSFSRTPEKVPSEFMLSTLCLCFMSSERLGSYDL